MESNFESWEWRERVYDGAVVWPLVTALKMNTQLQCNTVPTRIFGAESDSCIKCVLCKLSYTIHDILFTSYFSYYSSVHNSPTLCDVHPQYCLASNYFSHTLRLLGAASHCCSTLSCISLSWISMFPHCLSASIHKLLANWQMCWLRMTKCNIFCPGSSQSGTMHCQSATLSIGHTAAELESISSPCARNM